LSKGRSIFHGTPADLVKVFELLPFTASEIRAYLAATPAFAGRELTDERIASLARRTAGIPRELVETREELDSRGLLFDATGALAVAARKMFSLTGRSSLHTLPLQRADSLASTRGAEKESRELKKLPILR
jgi:hypothetical protein